MPDYSKQKSGTGAKGQPRHREKNAPGGTANPFGARPDKAALVARLAQKARLADKSGQSGKAGSAEKAGDRKDSSEG